MVSASRKNAAHLLAATRPNMFDVPAGPDAARERLPDSLFRDAITPALLPPG
jgi:hypothetical protein